MLGEGGHCYQLVLYARNLGFTHSKLSINWGWLEALSIFPWKAEGRKVGRRLT